MLKFLLFAEEELMPVKKVPKISPEEEGHGSESSGLGP